MSDQINTNTATNTTSTNTNTNNTATNIPPPQSLILPSDYTLSTLLSLLPSYSPLTPLSVSTHLLRSNGMTYTDPNVPLLTSVVVDRFVSELVVKSRLERDRRIRKGRKGSNKKRRREEEEEEEGLVYDDF
eukprot:CAMPEP_0182503836 /NCGR_PEP_ID=MMETSP1321-20130603/16098_1 /TAXON_ID=91990 /ORGANISM="Bolidomonas sp., Strain RCC1657" /LENGTH=130 /DNA_ID=CAMNT_0024709075 /DNA_START=143 /DNA_END=532 /DNA_ORIENTATION=-